MRNITVALDDNEYLRLEKTAAERNISVSDFARSTPVRASTPWISPVSPEEFRRLQQREAEIRAEITDFRASDILPRDELYDRKRFR